MTMKVRRPALRISVGSLYYALNQAKDGEFSPETFAEIIQAKGIKSINVAEESEQVQVYGSGEVYDTVSQTSSTNIEVETLAFHPEDLFAMRGEEVDESGLVFSGGSQDRPFIALGYVQIKKNNKYRFVWYPKCKLSENSDEITTSEESFNEQTETLTFTAMPFNEEGNTRVVVDTETEAGSKISENQFFSKVIVNPEDLIKGA